MTNIEQHQAAFKAFEARSQFIADLIKSMNITVNEFGTVMETDSVKLNDFYEAIENYDADVNDQPYFVGMTDDSDDAMAIYRNVKL